MRERKSRNEFNYFSLLKYLHKCRRYNCFQIYQQLSKLESFWKEICFKWESHFKTLAINPEAATICRNKIPKNNKLLIFEKIEYSRYQETGFPKSGLIQNLHTFVSGFWVAAKPGLECVVYFHHRLGAAHSKCWLKYDITVQWHI